MSKKRLAFYIINFIIVYAIFEPIFQGYFKSISPVVAYYDSYSTEAVPITYNGTFYWVNYTLQKYGTLCTVQIGDWYYIPYGYHDTIEVNTTTNLSATVVGYGLQNNPLSGSKYPDALQWKLINLTDPEPKICVIR